MINVNKTPPVHGEVKVSPKKTVWTENRAKKKMQITMPNKVRSEDFRENEFLTISAALNTRTISLLIIDLKSRQLIRFSRETIAETLKSLIIGPMMLAKRLNAM